ncbi:hypothetical protein Peur_004933 [Populus x canadensis]
MDGLVGLQLPGAARFHSRGLVLEQLGFMTTRRKPPLGQSRSGPAFPGCSRGKLQECAVINVLKEDYFEHIIPLMALPDGSMASYFSRGKLVIQQVTSPAVLHRDDALSYHCAEKDNRDCAGDHDCISMQASVA